MNILPIVIVGGIVALSGKKRRRRRKAPKQLPAPAAGRGEVFRGDDPPDVIVTSAGSRFTVIFPESPGTGYSWSLSASPPDNSVELVEKTSDSIQSEGVGGHSLDRVFIFEGVKAGSGSIVFHLQAAWLEGKQPPSEIVEIQTKIS